MSLDLDPAECARENIFYILDFSPLSWEWKIFVKLSDLQSLGYI